MNLQYSSHPFSPISQQPSSNPYARQSQLGQINSPLHPLNPNNNNTLANNSNNYHMRGLKQNAGGYPSISLNNNDDFHQSSLQGQGPQQQHQALTPKQISLLDKIDTIKRKGVGYGIVGSGANGADDKGQKFPPLGQLQFPNLSQYVAEDKNASGAAPNNHNTINHQQQQQGIGADPPKQFNGGSPAFNQKGGMINTFNAGYITRHANEQSRNSPYSLNNPYMKGPYDTYNRQNVNRLPHINQPANGGTANNYPQQQLYPVTGALQIGFNNHNNSQEESQAEKRKKYPSYDMNIHNSSLMNKMMAVDANNNHSNNGSHSLPPQGTSQSPQMNNPQKQYQQQNLSPGKKYLNLPVAPSRFTPEKQNPLSQSNSFNQLTANVQSDANGTAATMFKYSMKTKAGCTINKVTKTNQDSAIVNPKILSDINITQFAVADGHGLNGHFVSQMIKRNLPKNVQKFLRVDDYSADNIKNAVTRGFQTTNHELFNTDFDTNLSGSTLISVFIHENKLYCANVGDSRAVIGKQKPGVSGFRAHPLSIDHKPNLEREKQRVLKAGGRIDCQRDYTGQPLGPLRVWLQTMDMPGLAMTRSMGDKVGAQAGVIGEPEFEEMTITEEDKFMIVASDGVWEYLTDQEVVKIVGGFYDRGQLEQAAEKVIVESTNAWRRESLVRDDITCIVIFFNHPNRGGQKITSPYY